MNPRFAAAAFVHARLRKLDIFHVSDVYQLSAVLLQLESLPSYLFFQVSSRFSTSSWMTLSIGGLYLLPYSFLYQQLSEPVSLWNSSTLTTIAPEETLELPTFSLLSHTPPLPYGISSTSMPGTNPEMSLPEENILEPTNFPRNNTSSGPSSLLLLLTASTHTSSALSLSTEVPWKLTNKKKRMLKKPDKHHLPKKRKQPCEIEQLLRKQITDENVG